MSARSEPASATWFLGGGEMAARIRAFDWARTPLGAPEGWSPAMRTTLRVTLANRFPHVLWWGPEYIQFYNDAYIPIPGAKHPHKALGRPARECWSEIWHIIGPLVDRPFQGGPATWDEDIVLEINRHGFVEETHFTIAYSPVPDETAPGGIGGVLATVHEITGKVVGDRRVLLLRDLGTHSVEGRTAEESCAIAARTLANYDKDIPFALLYLIDADRKQARLAGLAGTHAERALTTSVISLEDAGSATAWPVADVLRGEKMVVVEDLAARFGEPAPAGPWSDPPHTAVVVPIRSNRAHHLAGFLVAGVSARLRFDEQYGNFLELVSSQIATAVANAREYEEERKRAEALAEIDRAKTVFFSNVSHEFRTPLTLMLGPIEELLSRSDSELPPAAAGQLQVVHRNSLRLLKLVNTLLDFSRIEAGRVRAVFDSTDLAGFTAELASVFRAAIERAGLSLSVDCPKLSEPVYVDRDMWEKIVLNLISNAFKFTLEGGVEVSLRSEGGMAVLRVRDSGVGIPQEEMPRLFERFHRIQTPYSRTHEGSGIGLALVQELVRLHGGSVRAESRLGEGSTFEIRVPLGTDHIPSDRLGGPRPLEAMSSGPSPYLEEALRWLPENAPPGGPPPSAVANAGPLPATTLPAEADQSRPWLLVADDNADMREYVARLLGEHYNVISAPDGEAALAAARERPPDIVITDIMMPRLDGIGLLRELRADPVVRTVPIILLSARAGEESRIEGMQQGADDYVVKPFTARELLARVAAHLETARIRKEAAAQIRHANENFRALVTATSDAVYRMGSDWKTMLHLSGREFIPDTEDASTTWLAKYIPAEDQAHVASVIAEAIRTRSKFELEHRVRRVDGTLGWTFSRAIPIQDATGEIVEWLGAATDITQRKQAEEALAAAMQRLSAHIDNSPLAIIEFDPQFRITRWSQEAERLFGWQAEEVLGRAIGDFRWVHEEDVSAVDNASHEMITGRRPRNVSRNRNYGKDGSVVECEWHNSAIYDIAGNLSSILSQVVDITERKRAEAVLREKQKSESLGVLAGGVAHDFNNLLIGVIGTASLIEEMLPPGHPALELATVISTTGQQLAHLTRQMLAYSGKGRFVVEPLDISGVVREISDLVRPSIPKRLALRFELANDLPPMEADRGQIQQVFTNLVLNAAEAIGNSDGLITVTTTAEMVTEEFIRSHPEMVDLEPGQHVVLAVRDSGCGMDAATRARIFDPFFSTKFAGRGLGLAAVSGILRSHKGAILVSTAPGDGSTFSAFFPATERQPEKHATINPSAAKDGSGVILVIDDEKIVREIATRALEGKGYTVLTAEGGGSAIDIFKRHPGRIDLAILDLSMPDKSGQETLPELRKIRPDVRILVSSGFSETETMKMFEGQQVLGFLQKPYTAASITEKVKNSLVDRERRSR